jgi:replicative DNA helicase
MGGSGSSRRAENRQVEISEISRAIKGLARELRVPVLALSQLSREAEKDDTGIPKLSHLRESGSIEQDADVVLMLWRPPAHQNPEDENLIKVSIAKQRNGPTGIVDLLFLKNMQRFENMAKAAGALEPDEEEYSSQDDEGTPF